MNKPVPRLSDEYRYRIMSLLEEQPALSQRELAARLGISLGKVNHCVKALMQKGLLKANAFCNSRNKRAYMYVLTPRGLRDRAQVTLRFLQRKLDEYEALEKEIADIRARLEARRAGRSGTDVDAPRYRA
jgi:EPS-associated MarR family transcriptional regulator